MKQSFKILVSVISATAMLSSSLAFARDISCLDYYRSYVIRSTYPENHYPTTVILVNERPHYRDHYPVYHEGRGGGRGNRNDSSNANDEFVLFAILAGLLTTTAAEVDSQLNDAETMLNILTDAQMGDGVSLREFTQRVASTVPQKDVSVRDVAAMLNWQSSNLDYCRMGDLDSVSEVVFKVSNSL